MVILPAVGDSIVSPQEKQTRQISEVGGEVKPSKEAEPAEKWRQRRSEAGEEAEPAEKRKNR